MRSRKLSPSALIAIGAAAVIVIAISVFLFLPRQGGLVVAVAGPGKKQVDTVQVYVDGHKQCDTSPCMVRDLAAGTAHIVKIKATGYASPADQPVSIKAGEDTVVNIDLTPASGGSGLKVSAVGSGLKLWVDGKEIGSLPQDLKDIAPGEHTIKVGGNDRYETYEEKVTVPSDEQKVLGPLKLKVLRGVADIEPGSNADGAKVMLVSGSEKRALPKLPTRIDIATDKDWKLVATRKGYSEFQVPLSFDTGEAERTFRIDMSKSGQEAAEEPVAHVASPRAPTPATPPPTHKGKTTEPTAPVAGAKTPAKPAAGQGTLNVNSIPVSNVIVDGRPMGSTPKMGLSVAAGTHTIVFVHPEHGRKVVTVNVAAGQTATAATRFP
jgi:serine/threonine-protein kinase